MQPLWKTNLPRVGVRVTSPSHHQFSVLGTRFVYQPDDMRLYQITSPQDDGTVVIPGPVYRRQWSLPQVAPLMLVLNLTNACTLRCKYCFVDDGTPCTMSAETARHAMTLIPQGRPLQISFFGGEPLLAWDTLQATVDAAVRRAGEQGVRTKLHVTTNGTQLNEEVASYLDEYDFSLIISIDGPARLHDAMRPQASGTGSYQLALDAIARVARHPKLARRTTLRATFDGTGAHLLTRVKHLNSLAHTYGLGNVSVEPADLSEGCSGVGVPVAPSEALYEEYMDVAEWIVAQRRRGQAARFHHIDIRLQRLQQRTPAVSECGAGVGYLAVEPDGTLHACHRLASPIGSVAKGVNLAAQAPWRDNRYYLREGCPACPWRNLCGGGCRWISHAHHGDIRKPDSLGCWLTNTCANAAAWILSQTA